MTQVTCIIVICSEFGASNRCDCDSLSHHGAIPGSIEATIAGSAGELLIFPVLTLAF